MQKQFLKDKYIDPMRRCHYINPITAAGCEAPPQIGKNFCYAHDPAQAEKRLEGQRAGGRNRRQPEPPPRIPPNLPLVKLESRGHILVVQEAMINFVLQGQMDIRVANNIGYLCMGALMTIDSTERAERQARLDAERAAHRAEDKAEKKAAREAKQAEKAAQAEQQAAQKASEEAAQQTKPENRAAPAGPDDLTAHNFGEAVPPESAETKPEAQTEAAQKQAAENGAGAPNQAERRLPLFLRKRRMIVTKRPATEHESAPGGLNHG
jgi:hypothetical protein